MKEKVEYLKWSLAGDVRTLEQREQTAKTRLADCKAKLHFLSFHLKFYGFLLGCH